MFYQFQVSGVMALALNTIINDDWITAARTLPDRCVHTMITSPPYWGQRDYGVDGQLGLEKDFEDHIEKLVVGFREMRRILRDDGIMWVNYSDKYSAGKCGRDVYGDTTSTLHNARLGKGKTGIKHSTPTRPTKVDGMPSGNLIGLAWRLALALQADGWILRSDVVWAKAVSFNDVYSGSTMPESVNGTRWERCRVKMKSQKILADGRYSDEEQKGGAKRASINTDWLAEYKLCPGCPKCEKTGGYVLRRGSWRSTRAHEYVFQFVKQIPYYADMEAVKEPQSGNTLQRAQYPYNIGGYTKTAKKDRQFGVKPYLKPRIDPSGRNIRDVWTINPQSYPDAHYATFPEKLVEPCIRVSTSQKGVCPKCGAQWARVIDSKGTRTRPGRTGKPDMSEIHGDNAKYRTISETTTLSWRPTCSCNAGDPVPAIVYDPFIGSGTVAAVAAKLDRNYMGSELSAEYMKQAEARILEAETGIWKQEANRGQGSLFNSKS